MKKLILLSLALVPSVLLADVKLPSLISDNMVLQSSGANVWGHADPGEKIAVQLADKKFTTEADADGKWAVKIPASDLKSGETYELTIAGKNTVTIHNVVAGEVWLGSGQSNMGWRVDKSANAAAEIATANYPMIRLFKVHLNASADEPQDDCRGEWEVCTPETVGPFSGVAYFFARELHAKLKVPIGMIESCWGGTPAQVWTPREALAADSDLAKVFEGWQKVQAAYPALKAAYDKKVAELDNAPRKKGKKAGPPLMPPRDAKSNHRPSCLYNNMIAPLTPFVIKGVIWDQGEANVTSSPMYRSPVFKSEVESNQGEARGKVYGKLLPALINSWRKEWGDPNLPFYYTQLANIHGKQTEPSESNWAIIREAQAKTLKLPHTGMAVVIDIGEAKTVHPLNKQDVGKRLAAIALSQTYGMKNVVFSGPVFSSMKIEGEKAILSFRDDSGGLVAKNGVPLKGFAMAGADRKFHWANAQIDGMSIVLTCPEVSKPVAVRYGWADNPDCDLVNQAGLPASPFRTDNWDSKPEGQNENQE